MVRKQKPNRPRSFHFAWQELKKTLALTLACELVFLPLAPSIANAESNSLLGRSPLQQPSYSPQQQAPSFGQTVQGLAGMYLQGQASQSMAMSGAGQMNPGIAAHCQMPVPPLPDTGETASHTNDGGLLGRATESIETNQAQMLQLMSQYQAMLDNPLTDSNTASVNAERFKAQIDGLYNGLSCEAMARLPEEALKQYGEMIRYQNELATYQDCRNQAALTALNNLQQQLNSYVTALNNQNGPISQLANAVKPYLSDLERAEGMLQGGNKFASLGDALSPEDLQNFNNACGSRWKNQLESPILTSGLNALESTFTGNLQEQKTTLEKSYQNFKSQLVDQESNRPAEGKNTYDSLFTYGYNSQRASFLSANPNHMNACEFVQVPRRDLFFLQSRGGPESATQFVSAMQSPQFDSQVYASALEPARNQCRSELRQCFMTIVRGGTYRSNGSTQTIDFRGDIESALNVSGNQNNSDRVTWNDLIQQDLIPNTTSAPPMDLLTTRVDAFLSNRGGANGQRGQVIRPLLGRALARCGKNIEEARYNRYQPYKDALKQNSNLLFASECSESQEPGAWGRVQVAESMGRNGGSGLSCSYNCYKKQSECVQNGLECKKWVESAQNTFEKRHKDNKDLLTYHLTNNPPPGMQIKGPSAIVQAIDAIKSQQAFVEGQIRASGLNIQTSPLPPLLNNFLTMKYFSPYGTSEEFKGALQNLEDIYAAHIQELKRKTDELNGLGINFEEALNPPLAQYTQDKLTDFQASCNLQNEALYASDDAYQACQDCPKPGAAQQLLDDAVGVLTQYGLDNGYNPKDSLEAYGRSINIGNRDLGLNSRGGRISYSELATKSSGLRNLAEGQRSPSSTTSRSRWGIQDEDSSPDGSLFRNLDALNSDFGQLLEQRYEKCTENFHASLRSSLRLDTSSCDTNNLPEEAYSALDTCLKEGQCDNLENRINSSIDSKTTALNKDKEDKNCAEVMDSSSCNRLDDQIKEYEDAKRQLQRCEFTYKVSPDLGDQELQRACNNFANKVEEKMMDKAQAFQSGVTGIGIPGLGTLAK